MKKVVFLACLLGCLFWGCSKKGARFYSWMEEDKKVKILSTTAIINDLVQRVGGDRIDAIPLIWGEIDPHSYEIVKGDIEKFAHAKVVFANGLNLEHGASLQAQLGAHSKAIFLGDEIRRDFPEKILLLDDTIDPHIWMDVSLWMHAVDPIVRVLGQIDPEGKETYVANGEEVKKELLSLHNEIKFLLSQVPLEKRYLVTSHDAFHYFGKAYLKEEGEGNWQKRCVAPEGLAPDSQLSVMHIQEVVSHLLSYRIQVLFPESNLTHDSLKKIQQVCKSRGMEVRISESSLYGDSMGDEDTDAKNYPSMMRHNAHALIKEWE